MNKTRTGSVVAAVALAAATTVAAAPAHAAPATAPVTTAETGVVQYDATGGDALLTGSLENEMVQVGLVLIAGIGVSIALAVGAGLQGGAFELPQIPGLPF